MLSRSSTKPIVVALGTATLLTLSTAALPVAALAADPSPTAGGSPDPTPQDSPPPSDSPPDTPPPDTPPPDTPPPDSSPPDTPGPSQQPPPYRPAPSLAIRLSLSATTAAPGGSVTATAQVSAQRASAQHAVVRFSASSANAGGPVSLGALGGERTASSVVHIPAGHSGGSVTVTATVSADRASARSATGKITIQAVAGPGAAVVSGEDAALPPSLAVPGLPGSAAALGGPAQAQLPMIAQEPPAVAPGRLSAIRPVSLRTKTTPLGLDPTSYRLLWTQVAWLTALLVGISLSLTQLRLNRRRVRVGGSARGRGPAKASRRD